TSVKKNRRELRPTQTADSLSASGLTSRSPASAGALRLPASAGGLHSPTAPETLPSGPPDVSSAAASAQPARPTGPQAPDGGPPRSLSEGPPWIRQPRSPRTCPRTLPGAPLSPTPGTRSLPI